MKMWMGRALYGEVVRHARVGELAVEFEFIDVIQLSRVSFLF